MERCKVPAHHDRQVAKGFSLPDSRVLSKKIACVTKAGGHADGERLSLRVSDTNSVVGRGVRLGGERRWRENVVFVRLACRMWSRNE